MIKGTDLGLDREPFFKVEEYKGVEICQHPISKHCRFGKKFALTLERARAEIDRLQGLGIQI